MKNSFKYEKYQFYNIINLIFIVYSFVCEISAILPVQKLEMEHYISVFPYLISNQNM